MIIFYNYIEKMSFELQAKMYIILKKNCFQIIFKYFNITILFQIIITLYNFYHKSLNLL